MTVKTLLFTDSSITLITMPADWPASGGKVEAFGGGGSSIVCGGSGGAWAVRNAFIASPGQVVPCQIAPYSAAANGTDPVDTWFSANTYLLAKSGHSAPFTSGDKCMPGALASECIGDAANDGGASGYNNDFGSGSHSGGGGSASPYGPGLPGGNAQTGITTQPLGDGHGGDSTGAGKGGAIVTAPSNGNPGQSNPDGGGGGSISEQGTKGGDGGFPGGGGAGGDSAGAIGAGGQIRLTWTVNDTITGSGSSTQAANTSIASGAPVDSGSAASVQGSNVANATGLPIITGAGASVAAPNASTASGTSQITGTASSTQQPNISTGSSAAPRTGPVDPTTAPVYAENRFVVVAHESRVAYLTRENRIVDVAR